MAVEATWQYHKDPEERLDFTANFEKIMVDADGLPTDEAITAATWVPDPNDGDIEVLQITWSGKRTSAMIRGGVAGETYDFTIHVTTLEGSTSREYERTGRMIVRER